MFFQIVNTRPVNMQENLQKVCVAWEWMYVKSGFEAYISIDLYLLTPTEHSTSYTVYTNSAIFNSNSIPNCNTPEEQ